MRGSPTRSELSLKAENCRQILNSAKAQVETHRWRRAGGDARRQRAEAFPGATAPGLDKYFYYKHSDMSWAKLSVRKRISHRIVTLAGAGKNKSVQGRADRNRVDTKLEEKRGGGCQVNDVRLQ